MEIKQKNESLIINYHFQVKIEDITDSYENKLKNNSNLKI